MQVISEENYVFPCQSKHTRLDSRIAFDCNFKHGFFSFIPQRMKTDGKNWRGEKKDTFSELDKFGGL